MMVHYAIMYYALYIILVPTSIIHYYLELIKNVKGIIKSSNGRYILYNTRMDISISI
jgi:hypothetical protein